MALTKDVPVLPMHRKTTMTLPLVARFYDLKGEQFTRFKFVQLAHSYSLSMKTLVMWSLILLPALFVLSARVLFLGDGLLSPNHAMVEQVEQQKSWAQYSPFFPVKPYDRPTPHCKVIQANIVRIPSLA